MNNKNLFLILSTIFILCGCGNTASVYNNSQCEPKAEQKEYDDNNKVDETKLEVLLDSIENIYAVDKNELIIQGIKNNCTLVIKYCENSVNNYSDALEYGIKKIRKQKENYVLYYDKSAVVLNSDLETIEKINLDNLQGRHIKFLVSTSSSKVIYQKAKYDDTGKWLGDGLYISNCDGTDGKYILMFNEINDCYFAEIDEMVFDKDENNILFSGTCFDNLESGENSIYCHGIYNIKNTDVIVKKYNENGIDVKGDKILTYSANKDPRVDEISGEISIFDGEEKKYRTSSKDECINVTLSDQGNYFITLDEKNNVLRIYSCMDGTLVNQINVLDNIISFNLMEKEEKIVILYCDDNLNNILYEVELK